jgi:serine/threonine protein kinase/Tfp pilus assembly protein PilF
MEELLQANTTISHYRIISRLGAGGMGEVYLAEDTKLGRRVALKLLPPDFTGDLERLLRFEQEARAASALNHPNIITVHEVGLENGTRFIATEYIEGVTLRQRLRHGRMSVREALDVAVQVASALAAAHQVGIIHRDIKPENVMLRPDGYVKVLDFGIVKLTEKFAEQRAGGAEAQGSPEAGGVKTESNVVMGSPSYMSPEQARGLPVDGRTDIFSLGVVLYEMLAGRRPFDGETITDVIVAILNRRPQPLSELAPDVSARLERIVGKALAKDRDGRYQTINDLLKDLRRQKQRVDFESGMDESVSPDYSGETTAAITSEDARATVREVAFRDDQREVVRATSSAEYIITEIKRHKRAALAWLLGVVALGALLVFYLMRAEAQKPIDSIAVLPFANRSADPNTEYLSDGITESLINNLSGSRGLRVMSRNSVFRYKGKDADAKTVGRELGVRAVLTGRIVERGDSLQISVELVDARDNSHVWGEQYSKSMSDLISMQEEIARQVAEHLRLRLTGEDQRRVSKRYTDDAEAYQLYLKGRFYWNKRTEDGLKKGIEYFKQAIEKDPGYAQAYVGLADCYAILVELEGASPKELYPKVKATAQKALELDDSLAEAHTSLGAAYEYEWNWAEAEKQYKQAIELNPNYATAHHWYAAYLISRLRADEAIQEMRLAQELDPLSLIINTSLGRVFYGARRYDQAMEQLRKTIDMDPNFAEAHFQIAMVYEQKRMYAEAISEFEKSTELFQDRTMRAWVGRVFARSGRRAEAERVISEMKEMASKQYVSPYPMATIYAALGDKDRAFEYLEKVYDEHSYYVVWLNIDSAFDGLRSDARFQDLLRRVGLTP